MSSRFVKVILVLTCVVSSVFATLSSQAQVPVTVVFSDGLTGHVDDVWNRVCLDHVQDVTHRGHVAVTSDHDAGRLTLPHE